MKVDKDFTAKVRLRKMVNDKIDLAVETGRKHKQPDFVMELIDKTFRTYCLSLHEEKRKLMIAGEDAEETKDVVCQLLANMLVELLINIAPKGGDPNYVVQEANHTLALFTHHLNTGIGVNYGLTTDPVYGKVMRSNEDLN